MKVCFSSRVDPGQLDCYREAHAAVWPEMLEALRDTGWRDYRLYLGPDGLLVGVVDLAETDPPTPAAAYAAAQRRMAATSVNARWQAAMAELFAQDGAPDEGMSVLDPIFDLDSQLEAHGLKTTRQEQ